MTLLFEVLKKKMVIFKKENGHFWTGFWFTISIIGEFGPRVGWQIGNGVNSVTDVTSLYNRCVCGNIKLA